MTGKEKGHAISNFIRHRLLDSGRYQKDLAAAIGVPVPTVNTWITKGRDIPAQYIIPIADFLGVSVLVLLQPPEIWR